MEELNKKKPFDIVYGVPGVGFWQNGQSFKPNGEPVKTVRRMVTNDSGERSYMEMSEAMSKQNEPDPEPELEEVKVSHEVPEFVKNLPEENKYPSTMTVDECIKELNGKGIKFPESALREELRELVKKNR